MKRLVWSLVVFAVSGCFLGFWSGSQERGPGGNSPADTTEFAGEVAEGMAVSIWARDEHVASPVALAFDDLGRAFVTQTTRRKSSNLDIRNHRDWMAFDLGLESIADKRAFYRRMLAPERSDENTWLQDCNEDGVRDWRDLTVEQEKIHRVVDTDGDGRADASTVFADGFETSEVTGVAAGVFAFDENVFATVAPHLWKLRDTDGDGTADVKRPLVDGFGVHMSYAGHDMSGPTMGPDGRIYWSIGDIGFNVRGDDGRQWAYPHEGAILRAEPDGSNFEVFARGLRNPQEFAFDKWGNIISVDNDGDRAGEHERIVYITEDSDTGWRTNWQFGKYGGESSYNVWMAEGLHKPHFEGQPAYITPAVALYKDGPAGFAYNPGTALSPKWRDHFFVTSFTGAAAQASLWAFDLAEKGASFELKEDQRVLQGGILATSIDFAPDGALYLADWMQGWEAGEQGRIWKLDTEAPPSRQRQRTRRLINEGMAGRSINELGRLLRYPDQRVRMQAQLELVERGAEGAEQLRQIARDADELVARVHAIWGIGQLGRDEATAVAPLVPLLEDASYRVRAQVAKVIGEAGYEPAAEALVPLLDDASERVRFFSAIALGKVGGEGALQPIVDMLADGRGDPYLRHAGATGLARIGDVAFLKGLADHPSETVRLAAVVALRRLQDPAVRRFLNDESEQVITEAARAIHDDTSIDAAMPDLARLAGREGLENEALLRRVLNANLRLGRAQHARRLAGHARREAAPTAMRVEALNALRQFPSPSRLDRVEGRYRDLEERDADVARRALADAAEPLLAAGQPDTVRAAAAEAVGALGYAPAGGRLLEIVAQENAPGRVRRASLLALSRLEDERLVDAVQAALESADRLLRQEAQQLVTEIDVANERAVELLETILEQGTLGEQQAALQTLGGMDTPASNELLDEWMSRLLDGDVPPSLQLDLLQAADQSTSGDVAEKVARYREAKPEGDVMAAYHEALFGGSVQRGREIFFEHSTAQCIRCHQVSGQGGAVGPELTSIGARADRPYLLQSLVEPGAHLAPGFGTVTLELESGRTVSGALQEETDEYLVVQEGDGTPARVDKENIAERTNAPSAMPSMQNILSKEELRDVVAYLASLTGEPSE